MKLFGTIRLLRRKANLNKVELGYISLHSNETAQINRAFAFENRYLFFKLDSSLAVNFGEFSYNII